MVKVVDKKTEEQEKQEFDRVILAIAFGVHRYFQQEWKTEMEVEYDVKKGHKYYARNHKNYLETIHTIYWKLNKKIVATMSFTTWLNEKTMYKEETTKFVLTIIAKEISQPIKEEMTKTIAKKLEEIKKIINKETKIELEVIDLRNNS